MSYLDTAAQQNRSPINVVKVLFDNAIADSGTEYFSDARVPLGQQWQPCMSSIQFSPSKITDSGLGYRCSCVVTLQDFPHESGTGTYFGRLFAKNPYYIDRKIEVYRGFDHIGFSLSNCQKALYFIKKIEGPDDRGVVKITAADVLTKLDGEEAQFPKPSYGSLSSSVTDSFTGSINIVDNTNFGVGSYAIIDDEIVQITAKSGADTVTIGYRARFGTKAAAHDADAPIRVVGAMTGQNVVDFIYGLFAYTQINYTTYINLSAWYAHRDLYLALDTVTGVVKEPTPVKDVITSLCKQFNIAIWWDDEAQLINIKALGPSLSAVATIDKKSHILNVGHSVSRDQTKAVSQVWVYYGKIDHSKGDEGTNFLDTYVYNDSEVETGLGKPSIQKVYCSHVPDSGTATASKIASRIAGQKKKGDIEFKFRLDAQDAVYNVGDGVTLSTDLNQGDDGLPSLISVMITERMRRDTWVEYSAIATGVEIGVRYATIAANSQPDYTSATATQKSKYGFIASNANVMSNGDDPYLIL